MGLRDRLDAAWATLTGGPRVSGFPTSSNRASSFHLSWNMPRDAGPIREVSTTLEILEPPRVPRLYFWALQVSFSDRGRAAGGAHLGLQWHPGHPGSRAANWGGYDASGRELDGSTSPLPSALRNVNTRDFAWDPGVPYRLRIRPGGPAPAGTAAWRGEITDLRTGEVTAIRDLHPSGGELDAPMVWSEVFARCDDPSVVVRWSDFEAIDMDGNPVRPLGMTTNYQRREDGGCDNTRTEYADGVALQTTNTRRQGEIEDEFTAPVDDEPA